MIILAAALGIFGYNAATQAAKTAKPPVVQLQEKTYKLTKPMEVAGDEAVLDGHGATLSGSGSGSAIHVGAHSHVTVKNVKITGFADGVQAQGASDLTLVNVTVTECGTGIRLEKIAGGMVQGLQAHSCGTGAVLAGCSKVIFEHGDLSQCNGTGLSLSATSNCVVRENKIVSVGDGAKGKDGPGVGLVIENGSAHNQVLRNIVVRCKTCGIRVSPSDTAASDDNTVQGNDVSWTVGGVGMESRGSSNKLIDNTAGYCQTGFLVSKAVDATLKGNLVVGNSKCGVLDEGGSGNVYDTNVFVKENGSPVALYLQGAETAVAKVSVISNIFMGYVRPIKVENVNPLTFNSNSFPEMPSVELEDVAEVTGKKPLFLDAQNEKPRKFDIVRPASLIGQVPTIYDRLGGVGVSTSQPVDIEFVVEGSLTGYFQGEEEELARYKGPSPVELTFPPRFEMQVRIRPVGKQPLLSFIALLGDMSMAKFKPADDSGDTLFIPGQLVDGDLYAPDHSWKPPKGGKAGEWWEVDLKTERAIDAVSLMPNPASPDGFWSKFHIAISTSGFFKGEETTFVTETNWAQRPGPTRIYRFPSVTGRYLRIIGDVDQANVQLLQFGAYGIRQ